MVCDKRNIIELESISLKINGKQILKNISLYIKENDITLIYGKSGSGKSSLLNVMNMFYKIDSGVYKLNGKVVDASEENSIAEIRRTIGFLHQELALIEELTIKENMEVFSKICNLPIDNNMLEKYLDMLALETIYNTDVSLLSGGERQRAAFLKLLIIPYRIVFIDEPTNNLDDKNIDVIIKGIMELKKQDRTVVMVSHNIQLQDIADCVVDLEEINGKYC